jgi:polar amino acid transport system substrate-binding protein
VLPAVALVASGCAAPGSARASARIAHDRDFPPFSSVGARGPEGLTIDILRAATARAAVDATLVPVAFAERDARMQSGDVAAYFPIAITPERRATLDFGRPLVVTGGALYVRAGQPARSDLAAFDGRTIVTPGAGPLAAFIRRTAPGVKLVTTADYPESFARLLAGEADAAALNFHVGSRMVARDYPGRVVRAPQAFLELPLAVAALKGRAAELLARIDTGLEAIRADGTLGRIEARWAT